MKKRDPRSEAAMREAIRRHIDKGDVIWDVCWSEDSTFVTASTPNDREYIAIFDLRDCFRKRAPLKGIAKKMRKAIQPRRKK